MNVKMKNWQEYFTQKGFHVVKMNAKSGAGVKKCTAGYHGSLQRKNLSVISEEALKNRPIRAMVVGIPNVGKSTFINAFAGKACAKNRK